MPHTNTHAWRDHFNLHQMLRQVREKKILETANSNQVAYESDIPAINRPAE
jgi:hypothetical protein